MRSGDKMSDGVDGERDKFKIENKCKNAGKRRRNQERDTGERERKIGVVQNFVRAFLMLYFAFKIFYVRFSLTMAADD